MSELSSEYLAKPISFSSIANNIKDTLKMIEGMEGSPFAPRHAINIKKAQLEKLTLDMYLCTEDLLLSLYGKNEVRGEK
jgi:hypothetical protein